MAAEAHEYVHHKISPTLNPALVALCRARPDDPVTWLANWLLANKPQPPLFSVTDAFKNAAMGVFALADEDGSGALEFREIRVIAEYAGEAKAILDALDKNKDNKISLDEWVDFFLNLFARDRAAAEGLLERSAYLIFEREFMMICRALFDEFDKDGSGELELPEVMMAIGDDAQGAEFVKFVDGEVGNSDQVVSVDEWMNYFFAFWRTNPAVARSNVGFLMQRAAELRMMPGMPPGGRAAAADRKLAEAISTEEGRAELKALFDTLDKDGDGQVTSKEWGKAVSKNKKKLAKFFGGQTMKEIGQQFNRIDADGSGDLTWDEFMSGVISMGAALKLADALETEEGQKELKALFATLDKDGDGKVTSKEWGKAISKNKDMLAKYFGGASLKEIGKAFKRLDADGSDDLTWEEFISGARALAGRS